MLDRISVVIIARDAAATLAATLESVSAFTEVVVYDNGSTDETMDIARRFPNVSLHTGKFLGFGPTKNYAVSLATNDWVFSLDADETISNDLRDFLADFSPPDARVVGEVRRDNFFMGRKVDKGGWGADWLVRLFNRKTHRFNDNAVHESVELTGASRRQRIPLPIEHNAVRHIGQFLEKIELYSEIRRETSSKTYHPVIIVLKSIFAFLKSYLLQGGLLAGWRGLVIAWNEANGVFFKYMKVYADRKR